MFDLYTTLGNHFIAVVHLSVFWGLLGFTAWLAAKAIRESVRLQKQPDKGCHAHHANKRSAPGGRANEKRQSAKRTLPFCLT